jgi:hypothetical protein
MWGAPLCLITYSVQYVAVSRADIGRSRYSDEIACTAFVYLLENSKRVKRSSLGDWKVSYTYFGFCIISLIAVEKVSSLKLTKSTRIAHPSSTATAIFVI